MRRACSAFVVLLAVCAAPSAEAIQHVLTPFHDALLEQQNLDHAVPIATVPRVGSIVALADARIVQNPSGQPFVLGAATLDVTNISSPRIGFTMTNTTQQPIQLSDVFIEAQTMAVDKGYARYLGSLEGQAGSSLAGEQLQPGATIVVDMPISPLTISARYLDTKYKTWGFLVLVGEWPGPASNRAAWDDWKLSESLLEQAFATLISEGKRR
jgi:hypothetical protein